MPSHLSKYRMNERKLAHFGAAVRLAVQSSWRANPRLYLFYSVKGFTADTFADLLVSRIGNGELRNIGLEEPAIIQACKEILVPCTYKGIETYLRNGATLPLN